MHKTIATLLALSFVALGASPALASSVYIEDMTWMEVRDRMKQGAATVIIPTGGTEQSGPHMATGMHNFVVEYTAGEIARALGDAMVAPVIAYVPVGRISPPEGSMKFPGTVSISETTFAALLEDAARSFKQHGFHMICFLGDHRGSQETQQAVAERLDHEWRGQGVRVRNISDYFYANGQKGWAEANRIKAVDPMAHAGFADTSEMMEVRPGGVHRDMIADYGEEHYLTGGVAGDPREATREYGQKLLSLKIAAAVKQIQNAELNAELRR